MVVEINSNVAVDDDNFREEYYIILEYSIIHLLRQVSGATDVTTREKGGCMEVGSIDKPASGALPISLSPHWQPDGTPLAGASASSNASGGTL